jgi:serine/threonine protein kinase/Flp pilus assembly protein TadD
VALKQLSPQLAADPAASERFLREGRIAARLVHRHIVGIHDVGVHEHQPYLAMEFMPGGVVSTDAPYPPNAALAIVREIALALDHAHSEGVIHRDLKPENILRRKDGSHALADFGIARARDSSSVLTQEGVTVGTPHYMSPEQLQALPLDGRADLYSLGVVLYQLLTGQLPYRGTEGVPVGMQHIHAPIPRLPDALSRYQLLLDSLLAKSPDQRPATGAELAHRIEGLQATLTPLSVPTQVLEPIGLHRKPWLWAALGLALLLVGSVWYLSAHRGKAEVASRPAAHAAMAAAPQEDEHGIAVLPLLNIGGNPDNEYFSDGLAETLLDMLSHVSGLKVIARSSSFAFKGKDTDAHSIGQTLGVSHLLEGSVQRSGGKVRITMQLVRCDDAAQLWSKRYDRDLADVFKVQDEIASEVVTALQGALPGQRKSLPTAGTRDAAAYDAFLKAKQASAEHSVASLRRAEPLFQQALARDPNYIDAMLGMVDVWENMYGINILVFDELKKRVDPMLDRAEAAEPGNAHTLLERGQWAALQGHKDIAGQFVQRAASVAPNDPDILVTRAWLADKAEDALVLYGKALAVDPLNPDIHLSRAEMLIQMDRLDEAETAARRSLTLQPNNIGPMAILATIAAQRGDRVEQMVWDMHRAVIDIDDARMPAFLATTLDAVGEHHAADAWMALSYRLQPKPGNSDVDANRIQFLHLRGDDAAALALAMWMVPRRKEWARWFEAMEFGCLSAQRLGRLDDMRHALVAANELPKDLRPETFRAWQNDFDTTPKDKLVTITNLGPCSWTQDAGDNARRTQIQALEAATLGADWKTRKDAGNDPILLANDRNGMVHMLVSFKNVPHSYASSIARSLGIADDQRVVAFVAKLQKDEAAIRAALPAALAREHLSMWPPGGEPSAGHPVSH